MALWLKERIRGSGNEFKPHSCLDFVDGRHGMYTWIQLGIKHPFCFLFCSTVARTRISRFCMKASSGGRISKRFVQTSANQRINRTMSRISSTLYSDWSFDTRHYLKTQDLLWMPLTRREDEMHNHLFPIQKTVVNNSQPHHTSRSVSRTTVSPR